MSLCDEIKAGGPKGCLGLDQIEWRGSGGAIYEIWKCEPCCGSPVNFKDACICLITWHFCGFCAQTHLFGSSMSQPCAIVPHCLLIFFAAPCATLCLRYNLRKKSSTPGNICGDTVCVWFCTCCAQLQHLRSAAVNDWALYPLPKIVGVAPQVKVLV